MTFLEPVRLLLIIPTLILYGGLLLILVSRSNRRISKNDHRTPRIAIIKLFFLALASLCLVLAFAKPTWGMSEVDKIQGESRIVVLLDVSYSMLASDGDIQRAERAYSGVNSLLTLIRDHEVAIIIFAGESFERSPFTTDMNALKRIMANAQDESFLVVDGSEPGPGIGDALDLLDEGQKGGMDYILWVTDGDFPAFDYEAIRRSAISKNVSIHGYYVGSESGGIMPDGRISFGNIERLSDLAHGSKGRVWDQQNLAGLAVLLQENKLRAVMQSAEKQPTERYFIFVLVGTIMLLGTMILDLRLTYGNRGLRLLVLLLTCAILGCSSNTASGYLASAEELFSDGDHAKSLAQYQTAREVLYDENQEIPPELQFNIANNLYLLGRFDESSSIAQAMLVSDAPNAILQSKFHYLLGLNQFATGDLSGAWGSFAAVIQFDEDNIDAKINLEVIHGLQRVAEVRTGSTELDDVKKTNGSEISDAPEREDSSEKTNISPSNDPNSDSSATNPMGADIRADGYLGNPIPTLAMLDQYLNEIGPYLSERRAQEILEFLVSEKDSLMLRERVAPRPEVLH